MNTKIFTLTTLLATCYLFANAQIQKGAILLGGGISFSNSTAEFPPTQGQQKQKNQSYNLSLGKAFKENTVYGVNLAYGHSSTENSSTSPNNTNSKFYNVGGYFRKYKSIIKDLYVYAEVEAFFTSGKQTSNDVTNNFHTDYRTYGAALTLMPGITYKLFKKMYLEITIPNIAYLQYSHAKDNQQFGGGKTESFSVATNLNSNSNIFGVGFRCIL